jgi:cytochrome P450
MTATGIDLSATEFWGLPLTERAAAFAKLRAEPRPPFFAEPDMVFAATGAGYYALVRHADVTEASRHPEVFSSRRGATSISDLPVEFNEYFGSMINMDDPRHARLRRIVSRAFTPRMIAGFESDVRRAAAQVVDDLLAAGPGDFVSQVAARLPLKFICDLMGIPDEHYETVFANSNMILAGFDPEFVSENPDQVVTDLLGAGQALADLVTSLGAERAQAPTGDLISALVTANVDGEQLTEAELASFFVLLVVAGNETTRNALSHALMLFTEYPDQRALLLADLDGRIGGAVEEIVRYALPDQGLHHERAGLPRGRQGGAVLLLGQPRRGRLPRPGAVRHHPLAQPARRLRRGRAALLPRRPPGPARAHGHAAGTAQPRSRHHRGRTGPAAVQLRQRDQATALSVHRLTH